MKVLRRIWGWIVRLWRRWFLPSPVPTPEPPPPEERVTVKKPELPYDLSIIIPYHEEGRSFILAGINGIKETVDVNYEIIVVDDCSSPPLEPIPGVRILRHEENLGVGQAFNTGVKEARSENLFLMGADVRFHPNQWASKILYEINTYPKAFTCTTCVGMNEESEAGQDFAHRQNKSRKNGATILIFHDKKSHPKKDANFRGILEAQWLPLYRGESLDSYEVPCILGAAYGVKKEWYLYVDPWVHHRTWGTLEPWVSLASWLFGGSCRTAPAVRTGHLFTRVMRHDIPEHHRTYNKLVAARYYFNDKNYGRLVSFLGENKLVRDAKQMLRPIYNDLLVKRREYEQKICVDIQDWCDRWKIDFRTEKKTDTQKP